MHHFKGTRSFPKDKGVYKFTTHKTQVNRITPLEELRTIEIKGFAKPEDITENQLRQEHNLNLRSASLGPDRKDFDYFYQKSFH